MGRGGKVPLPGGPVSSSTGKKQSQKTRLFYLRGLREKDTPVPLTWPLAGRECQDRVRLGIGLRVIHD